MYLVELANPDPVAIVAIKFVDNQGHRDFIASMNKGRRLLIGDFVG